MTGKMFERKAIDWRLLNKEQIKNLEQDQLDKYVSMFRKIDPATVEGASQTNRDQNQIDYVKKLEGEALNSYVGRYTSQKADSD